MTCLTVNNVGKSYPVFQHEWHRVARWFGLPFKPKAEHWVLRHVNFALASGEALGIVGQNGAGKSTLLKLITGTLQASEGGVHSQGRIAAILELGLGFNPELTGRQNVHHVAGLMGASHAEIREVIPEIEAFAEIGDYFDEPVRTYSSGMQARLSFAVATSFRPDILIVDEVLAVGDAYFVHKCSRRIREFQALGTALLVVAHDREAILSLCDRVILLDKGVVLMEGEPLPVMDYYNALIAARENDSIEQRSNSEGRSETISGTGEAKVESIRLLEEKGSAIEWVKVGQKVSLEVKIRMLAPLPELVVGFQIQDQLGRIVFGTNTHYLATPFRDLSLGDCLVLQFDFFANLGVGSYAISTALHTGENHLAKNFEWRDLALAFDVHNPDHPTFIGVNWLPPEVTVERC